ncbi:MAG: mandelate racemase/muconate lactonizing enzyme family protein [Burkholderiales bacterium]|nr:mandelate racemase/muconate lactonizing enzyme family protein [Burkholderiales bacterium]
MKIASVRAYPISMPLAVPRWTAHELMKSASVILVEVRTDDGLVGYGQVHGSPLKEICDWIARFGELVAGMDALGHLQVWEKLFALTSPRPGGVRARDGLPPPLPRASRPQVMAAIGGIDIALWDIKGKAAGVPVYRLLGGANRPIFTYATGGQYYEGAALDDCARELAAFVANGYRAVKLKCCGEAMTDEVERVRATRAAIGPDTLLMLDMNAPYALDDCIKFAHAVEPFGIHWLEEPLHWYLQPADFARLAAETSIPLAHCERELTRFSVRDFLANGSVYFVQFDSTRHAGFTESLRIAGLAEQFGVRIAPHQAPELHAHLCAAFPAASFGVESNGNRERDPLWYGMYTRRPEIRASQVHLDDVPGFGIEIDWDFVRRYQA